MDTNICMNGTVKYTRTLLKDVTTSICAANSFRHLYIWFDSINTKNWDTPNTCWHACTQFASMLSTTLKADSTQGCIYRIFILGSYCEHVWCSMLSVLSSRGKGEVSCIEATAGSRNPSRMWLFSEKEEEKMVVVVVLVVVVVVIVVTAGENGMIMSNPSNSLIGLDGS